MGTGDLQREIDIEKLLSDLSNEGPEWLSTKITNTAIGQIRLEQNHPLITIYRGGKYQIRGCTSISALEHANAKFQQILSDIGLDVESSDIEVRNLVFVVDLGNEIDLDQVAHESLSGEVEYEPEQFPGLIYRPTLEGGCALAFSSGKIIINGVTTEQSARRVRTMVEKLLIN